MRHQVPRSTRGGQACRWVDEFSVLVDRRMIGCDALLWAIAPDGRPECLYRLGRGCDNAESLWGGAAAWDAVTTPTTRWVSARSRPLKPTSATGQVRDGARRQEDEVELERRLSLPTLEQLMIPALAVCSEALGT